MQCWIPEIIDAVDLTVLDAALEIEDQAKARQYGVPDLKAQLNEGRIDLYMHLESVQQCCLHEWFSAMRLATRRMELTA